MVIIPLTQGQVALIDDSDYERVGQIKWHAVKEPNGKFHAMGWVNGRHIKLHRFLMGASPGEEVDHIDRNRLDCQWDNMRLVTSSENGKNKSRHSDNTSKLTS
jgi:hypothetical protein